MSNNRIDNENNKDEEKLNREGIKGILLWYSLIIISFLALLFISGKWNWLNAWIYLGISVISQTANVLLSIKKNPGMLNERGKIVKEGTKTFDKVFVTLTMPIILISMAIIALDAVVFRWSFMPEYFLIIGIFISFPGFILGVWVMMTNPYFELTVRIQEDRHHIVINSGPYKIIRHPGYASEIILLFSTPMMLGSWWGYIPIGVMILGFIVRTALEDNTLRNELSGYEEYAKRTRYRLVPHIW
ncbi:MAG: methyltransferase family protein [Promethearchaeota archaeon]